MFTSSLPDEATHTTPYLFYKPHLLVTIDNACSHNVGPSYSPDGPMLEFRVLSDRNNFRDLTKVLETKYNKSKKDGNLRTSTGTGITNARYLSNNALHSLFFR